MEEEEFGHQLQIQILQGLIRDLAVVLKVEDDRGWLALLMHPL